MPERVKEGSEAAYRETYAVYGKRYAWSNRTIKRLVALGKAAGDPCPLDDPGAMPAWWTRNSKHRVPAKLWELAPDAQMDLPPSAPEPEPPPEDIGPVLEAVGEMGLPAASARLDRLELDLSRTASEPGRAQSYLQAVARMAKVKADLREEAEKAGKLVLKTTVEQALVEFHSPIEREVRLLYRTMCEVMGLPASPDREAMWNAELDKVFLERFQRGIFAV